jgi:hypothetical protein
LRGLQPWPIKEIRAKRPEGPERSGPSGDESAVENAVGVHLTAGPGVERVEGHRTVFAACIPGGGGEQDAGEDQEAEAMRTMMSHTSLLSVTAISISSCR